MERYIGEWGSAILYRGMYIRHTKIYKMGYTVTLDDRMVDEICEEIQDYQDEAMDTVEKIHDMLQLNQGTKAREVIRQYRASMKKIIYKLEETTLEERRETIYAHMRLIERYRKDQRLIERILEGGWQIYKA